MGAIIGALPISDYGSGVGVGASGDSDPSVPSGTSGVGSGMGVASAHFVRASLSFAASSGVFSVRIASAYQDAAGQ